MKGSDLVSEEYVGLTAKMSIYLPSRPGSGFPPPPPSLPSILLDNSIATAAFTL